MSKKRKVNFNCKTLRPGSIGFGGDDARSNDSNSVLAGLANFRCSSPPENGILEYGMKMVVVCIIVCIA